MKEIQQKVRDFVEENQLDTSTQARLLDLVSEVGELAKEALQETDYGKSEKRPELPSDELGDCLFSLICLANHQNLDLKEALEQSLLKYQRRIEEKKAPSSGK